LVTKSSGEKFKERIAKMKKIIDKFKLPKCTKGILASSIMSAATLWSYHGNDPEVNITAIQPFLNYNLPDGWYLSSAPTITANWSADSSQQWTIPVGGGIGRVFKIGKQPVNTSIRAYHNVQSPRSGSDWQLQFQIQFLFPK
jgi:hypothetical protein